MNVEEEVEKLKVEIKRLGKIQEDGSYKVNQISITPFFLSVSRFSVLFSGSKFKDPIFI